MNPTLTALTGFVACSQPEAAFARPIPSINRMSNGLRLSAARYVKD